VALGPFAGARIHTSEPFVATEATLTRTRERLASRPRESSSHGSLACARRSCWPFACVLALGALVLGAAAPARAELSGSLDARALIGIDRRYGAAVMVDAWAPLGRLRLGGATGIGAVSGNDDASSRVFTPLALSLALMPESTRTGPFGVLRLGGYGGAQKSGLIAGLIATGSVGYAFSLSEEGTLRLGLDFWGLTGVGASDRQGGFFVGPLLGFGF
jgi:hypothetical protein